MISLWERFGARRCRACKAQVIFARSTTSGKAQIVDAEPSEKGNLLLYVRNGTLYAKVVQPGNSPELRLDHHATCPEADSFRRPRR